MVAKVKLEDIIDGMEMNSTEQVELVNTRTNMVVSLMEEFLRDAEDEKPYDHLPEWQQEQMIIAIDILENEDDYISLPSEYDVNEYGMMEDFCYMQTGDRQIELLNAINGRGAFRRFKDKLIDMNLEDAWYKFRDNSYRKVAIDFCEHHGLKYE